LTDGAQVTVPVFDAKSMILDLITNPVTMNESNIVVGYDIFTGNVDETLPENQCYGEIHMGNQWLPARDRYCSNNGEMVNEMPIAMIIFGDKSHTTHQPAWITISHTHHIHAIIVQSICQKHN
jgi:hypothetical protein